MQMDASPMWWAEDETILTTADILPDNVLYGPAGAGGKAPMQILERAKQMQVPLAMQQDIRNQIRRAFRFGLSQVMAARPQMTAQEVMAYNADELKQLAPNLVRIQRGLSSFIRRRAMILQRQGRVPPPPPEILQAGVPIRVEFVSPFDKAQKAEIAKGALGWVSTLVNLARETGDPSISDPIDFDGTGRILHDAMSGVPDIILDPRAIEQKRQRRAQMQQQQLQLANAERAVAIKAESAHADQAKTLASQRSQ
jgi:hypothetical protein